MMRTIAEALALVNWNGVFYGRYGLDRHVTALEGDNGAGKTTVMIAAYVVLLPDMSRLRFTNLGETGATGGDKGIWGRLGKPGRPSYTVIDFALPTGQRLVAGVHLERKGEPSVEPTPFVVLGLPPDIRLQSLLLLGDGGSEQVPELPELRENAARLGGRLLSFTSARDYFAALFEHGVTPLRLGTDEERNKLNEMLRTSMTGGISRALTSELRSFLLKEEGGLADTLQRMRTNLDACRRTRTEVQESQRLECEIGGVFEAGQGMFAAALLATRERAEEYTHRIKEAEEARSIAASARVAAQDALNQTLCALDELERRRGEIGNVLEAARALHERMREALAAEKRLKICLEELTRTQAAANEAMQRRNEAEEDRRRMREELSRARESYHRAAEGLGDLQQGIEELHRRADAYRRATRYLHEAEEALGGSIPLHLLGERMRLAQEELAALDQERHEIATRLSDAATHRTRHAQVEQALCILLDGKVTAEQAYEAALSALQMHRKQAALAERIPMLEHNLAEECKRATRSKRVLASEPRRSALAMAQNQACSTWVGCSMKPRRSLSNKKMTSALHGIPRNKPVGA